MTVTRVAGAAALLTLAACGDSAASAGSGAGSGTPLAVGAHNFAFDPSTLSVQPGATVTVTFTNTGTVRHNFTVPSVNVSLDADPGTSQTVTFTAPQSGTLAFHCEYHPTKMMGTITVGGSAPAVQPSTSPSSGGSSSGGYPGY